MREGMALQAHHEEEVAALEAANEEKGSPEVPTTEVPADNAEESHFSFVSNVGSLLLPSGSTGRKRALKTSKHILKLVCDEPMPDLFAVLKAGKEQTAFSIAPISVRGTPSSSSSTVVMGGKKEVPFEVKFNPKLLPKHVAAEGIHHAKVLIYDKRRNKLVSTASVVAANGPFVSCERLTDKSELWAEIGSEAVCTFMVRNTSKYRLTVQVVVSKTSSFSSDASELYLEPFGESKLRVRLCPSTAGLVSCQLALTCYLDCSEVDPECDEVREHAPSVVMRLEGWGGVPFKYESYEAAESDARPKDTVSTFTPGRETPTQLHRRNKSRGLSILPSIAGLKTPLSRSPMTPVGKNKGGMNGPLSIVLNGPGMDNGASTSEAGQGYSQRSLPFFYDSISKYVIDFGIVSPSQVAAVVAKRGDVVVSREIELTNLIDAPATLVLDVDSKRFSVTPRAMRVNRYETARAVVTLKLPHNALDDGTVVGNLSAYWGDADPINFQLVAFVGSPLTLATGVISYFPPARVGAKQSMVARVYNDSPYTIQWRYDLESADGGNAPPGTLTYRLHPSSPSFEEEHDRREQTSLNIDRDRDEEKNRDVEGKSDSTSKHTPKLRVNPFSMALVEFTFSPQTANLFMYSLQTRLVGGSSQVINRDEDGVVGKVSEKNGKQHGSDTSLVHNVLMSCHPHHATYLIGFCFGSSKPDLVSIQGWMTSLPKRLAAMSSEDRLSDLLPDKEVFGNPSSSSTASSSTTLVEGIALRPSTLHLTASCEVEMMDVGQDNVSGRLLIHGKGETETVDASSTLDVLLSPGFKCPSPTPSGDDFEMNLSATYQYRNNDLFDTNFGFACVVRSNFKHDKWAFKAVPALLSGYPPLRVFSVPAASRWENVKLRGTVSFPDSRVGSRPPHAHIIVSNVTDSAQKWDASPAIGESNAGSTFKLHTTSGILPIANSHVIPVGFSPLARGSFQEAHRVRAYQSSDGTGHSNGRPDSSGGGSHRAKSMVHCARLTFRGNGFSQQIGGIPRSLDLGNIDRNSVAVAKIILSNESVVPRSVILFPNYPFIPLESEVIVPAESTAEAYVLCHPKNPGETVAKMSIYAEGAVLVVPCRIFCGVFSIDVRVPPTVSDDAEDLLGKTTPEDSSDGSGSGSSRRGAGSIGDRSSATKVLDFGITDDSQIEFVDLWLANTGSLDTRVSDFNKALTAAAKHCVEFRVVGSCHLAAVPAFVRKRLKHGWNLLSRHMRDVKAVRPDSAPRSGEVSFAAELDTKPSRNRGNDDLLLSQLLDSSPVSTSKSTSRRTSAFPDAAARGINIKQLSEGGDLVVPPKHAIQLIAQFRPKHRMHLDHTVRFACLADNGGAKTEWAGSELGGGDQNGNGGAISSKGGPSGSGGDASKDRNSSTQASTKVVVSNSVSMERLYVDVSSLKHPPYNSLLFYLDDWTSSSTLSNLSQVRSLIQVAGSPDCCRTHIPLHLKGECVARVSMTPSFIDMGAAVTHPTGDEAKRRSFYLTNESIEEQKLTIESDSTHFEIIGYRPMDSLPLLVQGEDLASAPSSSTIGLSPLQSGCLTMSAGMLVEVVVRFVPFDDNTKYQGVISVSDNIGCRLVTLTGCGAVPSLHISPLDMFFKDVIVDEYTHKDVLVRNTGRIPVKCEVSLGDAYKICMLSQAPISSSRRRSRGLSMRRASRIKGVGTPSSHAAEYADSFSRSISFTLAPGKTKALRVNVLVYNTIRKEYQCQLIAKYGVHQQSGSVSIDGDEHPREAASGSGDTSASRFHDTSVSVPLVHEVVTPVRVTVGVAEMRIDSKKLDFGPVSIGKTSMVQVVLRNPGTAALKFEVGSVSHPSITVAPSYGEVLPNQSAVLDLVVHPTQLDAIDARVYLTSNGGSATLSCFAYVTVPQLLVRNPLHHDFGVSSTFGSKAPYGVTLYNSGSVPIIYRVLLDDHFRDFPRELVMSHADGASPRTSGSLDDTDNPVIQHPEEMLSEADYDAILPDLVNDLRERNPDLKFPFKFNSFYVDQAVGVLGAKESITVNIGVTPKDIGTVYMARYVVSYSFIPDVDEEEKPSPQSVSVAGNSDPNDLSPSNEIASAGHGSGSNVGDELSSGIVGHSQRSPGLKLLHKGWLMCHTEDVQVGFLRVIGGGPVLELVTQVDEAQYEKWKADLDIPSEYLSIPNLVPLGVIQLGKTESYDGVLTIRNNGNMKASVKANLLGNDGQVDRSGKSLYTLGSEEFGIGPDAQQTFKLSLDGSRSGFFLQQLKIESRSHGTRFSETLTLLSFVGRMDLSFSRKLVEFGRQQVGGVYTETLFLQNDSNMPISVECSLRCVSYPHHVEVEVEEDVGESESDDDSSDDGEGDSSGSDDAESQYSYADGGPDFGSGHSDGDGEGQEGEDDLTDPEAIIRDLPLPFRVSITDSRVMAGGETLVEVTFLPEDKHLLTEYADPIVDGKYECFIVFHWIGTDIELPLSGCPATSLLFAEHLDDTETSLAVASCPVGTPSMKLNLGACLVDKFVCATIRISNPGLLDNLVSVHCSDPFLSYEWRRTASIVEHEDIEIDVVEVDSQKLLVRSNDEEKLYLIIKATANQDGFMNGCVSLASEVGTVILPVQLRGCVLNLEVSEKLAFGEISTNGTASHRLHVVNTGSMNAWFSIVDDTSFESSVPGLPRPDSLIHVLRSKDGQPLPLYSGDREPDFDSGGSERVSRTIIGGFQLNAGDSEELNVTLSSSVAALIQGSLRIVPSEAPNLSYSTAVNCSVVEMKIGVNDYSPIDVGKVPLKQAVTVDRLLLNSTRHTGLSYFIEVSCPNPKNRQVWTILVDGEVYKGSILHLSPQSSHKLSVTYTSVDDDSESLHPLVLRIKNETHQVTDAEIQLQGTVAFPKLDVRLPSALANIAAAVVNQGVVDLARMCIPDAFAHCTEECLAQARHMTFGVRPCYNENCAFIDEKCDEAMDSQTEKETKTHKKLVESSTPSAASPASTEDDLDRHFVIRNDGTGDLIVSLKLHELVANDETSPSDVPFTLTWDDTKEDALKEPSCVEEGDRRRMLVQFHPRLEGVSAYLLEVSSFVGSYYLVISGRGALFSYEHSVPEKAKSSRASTRASQVSRLSDKSESKNVYNEMNSSAVGEVDFGLIFAGDIASCSVNLKNLGSVSFPVFTTWSREECVHVDRKLLPRFWNGVGSMNLQKSAKSLVQSDPFFRVSPFATLLPVLPPSVQSDLDDCEGGKNNEHEDANPDTAGEYSVKGEIEERSDALSCSSSVIISFAGSLTTTSELPSLMSRLESMNLAAGEVPLDVQNFTPPAVTYAYERSLFLSESGRVPRELRVKATVGVYNIYPSRSSLNFLLLTTKKASVRHITLSNPASYDVPFSIQSKNDVLGVFSFAPSQGTIPAGGEVQVALRIYSDVAFDTHEWKHTPSIVISGMNGLLPPTEVTWNANCVDYVFDTSLLTDIDFGLVLPSTKCHYVLKLANTRPEVIPYRLLVRDLRDTDLIIKDTMLRGKVQPDEVKEIPLLFLPQEHLLLDTVMEVNTPMGGYDIKLRGCGTIPTLSSSASSLDFGVTPAGFPKPMTFRVTNSSSFPLQPNFRLQAEEVSEEMDGTKVSAAGKFAAASRREVTVSDALRKAFKVRLVGSQSGLHEEKDFTIHNGEWADVQVVYSPSLNRVAAASATSSHGASDHVIVGIYHNDWKVPLRQVACTGQAGSLALDFSQAVLEHESFIPLEEERSVEVLVSNRGSCDAFLSTSWQPVDGCKGINVDIEPLEPFTLRSGSSLTVRARSTPSCTGEFVYKIVLSLQNSTKERAWNITVRGYGDRIQLSERIRIMLEDEDLEALHPIEVGVNEHFASVIRPVVKVQDISIAHELAVVELPGDDSFLQSIEGHLPVIEPRPVSHQAMNTFRKWYSGRQHYKLEREDAIGEGEWDMLYAMLDDTTGPAHSPR